MHGMSVLEGLWGKNTDKGTTREGRQRSGVFIISCFNLFLPQACTWKSYYCGDKTQLVHTVKGIKQILFNNKIGMFYKMIS